MGVENNAKAENKEEAAQKIQKAFHISHELPKQDEVTSAALQALVAGKAAGAEKLPSQAKINKQAKVGEVQNRLTTPDDRPVGKIAKGKTIGLSEKSDAAC